MIDTVRQLIRTYGEDITLKEIVNKLTNEKPSVVKASSKIFYTNAYESTGETDNKLGKLIDVIFETWSGIAESKGDYDRPVGESVALTEFMDNGLIRELAKIILRGSLEEPCRDVEIKIKNWAPTEDELVEYLKSEKTVICMDGKPCKIKSLKQIMPQY